MPWVIGIIAVLAVLVVIVAGGGALLPAAHSCTRSAVVGAPPAAVFETIRDVAAQGSWRGDVKSVEVLPAAGGRLRYRESGSNGAILFEVVEESAPSKRVVRIADDRLPFGGSWTWVLAPEGNQTRVTITEDGVIKNVVFRFLARFAFGYHRSLEGYLENLGRRFPSA